MTLKVELGRTYINREGVKLKVVGTLEPTPNSAHKSTLYLVQDETGERYNHGTYGNGYYVQHDGVFGRNSSSRISPNPRNLAKEVVD